MIKRLSLFFLGLTLTFSFSYAVSICNDNNAVYSDDNLCKSVCSSCSTATLTTGSVGNCDSAYFNFVYYNGKTYAVTKSLGFWTDFQNLAMPKDAGTNRVISSILPSGSVAWIGVYDSSMPNSYNTVDKSRFVYRDLSSLVYDNFASGEPNNYVDNADYGKVSVLGEHWVAMSSDGTWFDDGYHVSYGNDYKPKYAAVVEWEGPLSCVNVSTTSTSSGGQSSAVNNYCGGKTPCYICAVESSDSSTIQQCNLSQDNKNYLCPIHQTLCTATYQDPICPLGNYPCLKMSDGGSYCSDISCVDGSLSSNYVVDNTQEGANNQRDIGFSNGQCNGTIFIFSGRDRRCRPGGVETGGSDCCEKSKTWFGLGKCKASEQELAKLRTTYIKRGGGEMDYSYADANCHYVGSYCSIRIPGVGCVQKKKTFCCFSSPLARIIQEQGRSQLGIGWGEPKNPNCRGFTMDEFQKIDFSKINFDEWINFVMSTSNFTNTFQNSINKTINNIQNSY